METSQRRGRNAQDPNGPYSAHRVRKQDAKDSLGRLPANDGLDPNLQGRPSSEKGIRHNHSTSTELHICTYNVRTLRTDESLDALLEELEEINWDVIGLAETRRPENIVKLTCGHTLYTSAATNRSLNGVGFLVNKTIQSNILKFKIYSDRVAMLKLHINKKYTLRLIQVYAPTTSHDDEVVETFYEEIDQALGEDKTTYTIIMGDFNAKVGLRKDREEKGLGPFGIGERNDRGERLLDFVASRHLVIGNTLFKKSLNRYWTWESPNATTHNLIDYIISDRRDILIDVATVPKVDMGSDHRVVRAKVRINKKMERLRMLKRPRKRRIDLNKLATQQREFNLELKNKFAPLWDLVEDQPVSDTYNQFVQVTLETAEKLAKSEPSQTKANNTCAEMNEIRKMNKRRKALKPHRQDSASHQVEYTELNKTIRKKRRELKRKHRSKMVQEVLKKHKGPKTINRKLQEGRQLMSSMKDIDGTETSDKHQISRIVRVFTALSTPVINQIGDLVKIGQANQMMCPLSSQKKSSMP